MFCVDNLSSNSDMEELLYKFSRSSKPGKKIKLRENPHFYIDDDRERSINPYLSLEGKRPLKPLGTPDRDFPTLLKTNGGRIIHILRDSKPYIYLRGGANIQVFSQVKVITGNGIREAYLKSKWLCLLFAISSDKAML